MLNDKIKYIYIQRHKKRPKPTSVKFQNSWSWSWGRDWQHKKQIKKNNEAKFSIKKMLRHENIKKTRKKYLSQLELIHKTCNHEHKI
jgi:hypothetical protein